MGGFWAWDPGRRGIFGTGVGFFEEGWVSGVRGDSERRGGVGFWSGGFLQGGFGVGLSGGKGVDFLERVGFSGGGG